MSAKNTEGKRSARERMAAERERQRVAEKRRRTMLALLSVLGVLAVAGVIAVVVNNTKDDDGGSGPLVYPKNVTGEDRLAILDGKAAAPVTLTVYEDFRCPACQAFETGFSKTIHELVDSGQLKAEYRLVTLIDGNLGGEGSLNSANAAACAADQSQAKFRAYHDVLYANQPSESDDAFADKDTLKDLAKKVDGLDTAAFQACVDDGTHDSWVQKSNKAFNDSGHNSTPTVLLDGESIYGQGKDLTPAKLKQLVAGAAKS
ncbi:thioredoxin domain-containing protein [Streptomyces sp. NPDC051940]|uniref:DsbA family protein n=1 Tax=Streptomyces sp. NPDC051940 TaxID=3155675 RepID=UPI00344189EE